MNKSLISAEALKAALDEGHRHVREDVFVIDATYRPSLKTLDLLFNRGGMKVIIPVRDVPELANLSREDWRSLELDCDGDGLRIGSVDIDLSIPGLLASILPLRAARIAVARENGRKRSQSKSTAAKVNGKLGGRPRHVIA